MDNNLDFRIWDQEEGKWFEDINKAYAGEINQAFINTSGQVMIRTLQTLVHVPSVYPGRYILSQWTGKTDKEGTKAYTGDKVRCYLPLDQITGVVEYNFAHAGYRIKTDAGSEPMTVVFEVIGHIWECKEKMKDRQHGRLTLSEICDKALGLNPTSIKPPTGLLPRHIHDQDRAWELTTAIARYVKAGIKTPEEWHKELGELLSRVGKAG